MPRATPILNNFTAGELSPKMYGRTDFAKYHNGCQVLENMVVLPQGGATRRPGTRFIAEVKESAKAVRNIPFEFSTEQAYNLEFGDEYIHFYMDKAQIEDDGSPYEIESPYLAADIFKLAYVQSADVLYIVGADYPPAKLSRTGHTAWTLSEINFRPPPTSEQPVYPNTTIAAAGVSGNGQTFTVGTAYFLTGDVGRQIVSGAARAVITAVGGSPDPNTACTADILDNFPDTDPIASGDWRLTGSPTGTLTPDIKGPEGAIATLTSGLKSFRAADVGKYLTINGGFLKITAFTSSTVVKGEIMRELSSITGSSAWTLEDEEWTETNGYPDSICFHQGRLWFGRGISFWGSVIEDYENFAKGTDADASVTRPLLAKQVNVIRWLESAKELTAGTVGAEWTIKSSSTTDPITPDSIDPARATTQGSADLPPVVIGQSIVFVQRAGRKVRELTYQFEQDGYVAPDLTRLADHITKGGLVDVAYQQEPFSTLWYVRADGVLLGLTYLREEEIIAWQRHLTDGDVESVAVIPADDEYVLYLSVKRTINGAVKRYIEVLDPFEFGDDLADAFFVDCGLTYDSTPATEISGLDHLEGKTVSVLADGAVHPDCVVASGQITLDRSASTVQVGLPYTSELLTMKLDAGSATGTAQGKKQRVNACTVRFLETLGARIGYDENSMETVYFRTSADHMGSAPALFSGDKKITFPKGWGDDVQVRITQEQPLPLTVTAIIPEVTASDG